MISLSQTLSYIPGLVCGLQQPAITGTLIIEDTGKLDSNGLRDHVRQLIPRARFSERETHDCEWLAENSLLWLVSLFRSKQIICSERFHLSQQKHDSEDLAKFEFFFPFAVPPEVFRQCAVWLSQLLDLHSDSTESLEKKSVNQQFDELLELLVKYSAPSINRFEVAIAAFDLDVPIFPLNIDVYYLGQGAHCAMLSSSFTEKTPAIAANLARNKYYTAELLRNVGLPAPQQIRVVDKQQALAAADKLQYPVVVKAADLEEGHGVFPSLNSIDAVSDAFTKVKTLSKRILVEKHVAGRTHRFTVFQNRVIKIVQRIPGSVSGDGKSTITELVEQAQQTRRLQFISERQGRPALSLDAEALDLLNQHGLSPDSVPESGKMILLRKTDNASSGGSNKLLQHDEVHPDNIQLAIDAASALRLDFAGIDLIIPDAQKSWLDQDAIICEVNAQPSTGALDTPKLYQEIIRALIKQDGRIPVHLVILPKDEQVHIEALLELQKQLACNGLSCKEGLFLNGQRASKGFENSHIAARALLLNKQVTDALCVYEASEIVQYGLFTDRLQSLKIFSANCSADPMNEELENALYLLPPGTSYDTIDPQALFSQT